MVEMWKFGWLESKIAFEKCSTWNSYTFPNEHVILHVWHHISKPLVGPDIWVSKQTIDKHERRNYKTIKKWWKICSTSCNYFYINKLQIVKICKESVNMMYQVYKITCKESGRIYVGQSANPQKRFKRHALKPPKKMLIDVSYKPFVNCFELKVVFSSYRKYLCDCKKRRLISDLKTIQISCGYNILKGH